MSEQRDEGQVPAGTYYEDEISLEDLAIALWNQKWVIAAVAILTVAIGAGYAFTRPVLYQYTTTIEIGTLLSGEQTRPIEPPQNVVAKLERNYIPEAIRTYEEDLRDTNGHSGRLRVDASSPRDTDLVVLTSEGTEELADYYLPLHQRILKRLAEDHARESELERVRLKNELAEARQELQELSDERILKVERKELQNAIAAERNKLERLRDQEELLNSELENMDVQEELVRDRLDELSGYIEDARERRGLVQQQVEGGAEGMALMLIDNELQRDIDRHNELEERLLVEIPESRSNLRSSLDDNQREQELQGEKIDELEAQYEKLLLDQENRVPRAEARVEELETRVANLRETRAVLPPRQSLDPTGSRSQLILALSVVLGLMLGVFAALLVGFVRSVSQKLASENTNP